MPTIIDALLVTLNIDAKNFDAGRKQAEAALDATGKKAGVAADAVQVSGKKAGAALLTTGKEATRAASTMEAAGKTGASFYNLIREGALALGVTLTASKVVGFISETMTSVAQLGRVASGLNTSVPMLNAWGRAIEAAGGTAEDAQGSFTALADAINQYKLGNITPTMVALQTIMPGMDVSGDRPTEAIMMDIARAFQGMDAGQARLRAQQLGLPEAAGQFLSQHTPDQIKAIIDAQLKVGVASKDMADKMAELQKAAIDLKNDFVQLGQELLLKFAPAIIELIGDIADRVDYWRGKKSWEEVEAGDAARLATREAGEAAYNAATGASTVGTPALSTAAGGGQFGDIEVANNLPAGVIDSVWAQESGRGRNTSTSSAGAMGQFQFMPATAREYGLSDADTMDVGKSSAAAGRLLHDLMVQYKGDLDKALAGYNWGSVPLNAAIERAAKEGTDWHKYLPDETRKYIQQVEGRMRMAPPAATSAPSATPAPTPGTQPYLAHKFAVDRWLYNNMGDGYRRFDDWLHGHPQAAPADPDDAGTDAFLKSLHDWTSITTFRPPSTGDSMTKAMDRLRRHSIATPNLDAAMRRLRQTTPVDPDLVPRPGAGAVSNTTVNSHAETHIGVINVTAPGSDPASIIGAIRQSARTNSLVPAANTGLS